MSEEGEQQEQQQEEEATKSNASAAAILRALELDAADLDVAVLSSISEGPFPVVKCLDQVFRAKQRVDPAVQSLLDQALDPQDLRAAHAILLQDGSDSNSDNDAATTTTTNNNSSTIHTTVSWLKRIATTVWFVQLLLEFRSPSSSSTPQASTLTSAKNTNTESTTGTLSEQQATQMVLVLLQNLSKTIKSNLLQIRSSSKQTKDEVDANAVTCFAVGAYLRVVNPYVSSLPVLLSPLWKGICDFASSLNDRQADVDDVQHPYAMPFTLAADVMHVLLAYLRDGTSQTLTTMQEYIQNDCQVFDATQQAFQVKVLTFLVARTNVLLPCHVLARNSRRRKEFASSTDDNDSDCPLYYLVAILLQLRGQTFAAKTLFKRKNQQWPSASSTACLTEQEKAFLQAYKQLEIKVEQCLVHTWILRRRRPSTMTSSQSSVLLMEEEQRHDLNQLLRMKLHPQLAKPKTTRGEGREVGIVLSRKLVTLSFSGGKALVLCSLLEQSVAAVSRRRANHADVPGTTTATATVTAAILHESDVQSLLRICQELIFSTLPKCADADEDGLSALCNSCLNAMALALVLCYQKGAVETRNQLDRLLLRWLAPPPMSSSLSSTLHPMTREVLISLVHLCILHLCRSLLTTPAGCVSRSDSPRSVDLNAQVCTDDTVTGPCSFGVEPPLMKLLVKILFDSRTQTAHRRNVASVLVRLLEAPRASSGGGGDANGLSKDASAALQLCIATQVQHCIKQDVKEEKRKRRKSKSSAKNNRTNHNHNRPLGAFAVEDVRVLMKVLTKVSLWDSALLDSELASLARELSGHNSSGCKAQVYTVGRYSRNSLSLLLSLLTGLMETMQENGCLDTFKCKIGLAPEAFTVSIVKWLTQQQTRASKANRVPLRKAHSSVIMACLQVIGSSFVHVGMHVNELRSIVKIVKVHTLVACQILQADSPWRDPEERRAAASIVFAAVPLFARITKVIPTSCPADILRDIAATFKTLFETRHWPIVAHAITSLVEFASTIPSAHQFILPECIPSDAQGLLQCRLQGLVFRDDDAHTEAISDFVNDQCRKTWRSLLLPLKNERTLFVPTSADVILEGSHVLTMPTQDGRSATVIFEPGKESLEDIEYMMGPDDFNKTDIRVLEQVRLIGNGKGCRLLSKGQL